MNKLDKNTMVFWHSEGAIAGANGVSVRSANLIDFFVSLHSPRCQVLVAAPALSQEGLQHIEGSEEVELSNAPAITGGRVQALIGLVGLLKYMISGEGRTLSREAKMSVSVGLSGFGTLASIRRVFIDKRAHAYVVRGNRLITVGTSSRNILSKSFAILRVRFYLWVLLAAVRSGRVQVWFQGAAYLSEVSTMLPASCHDKLFALNAVLRDMPAFDEFSKTSDLVFLGRLTIEKGLIELVESIGLLKVRGMKVTLKIVGHGPDRPQVEEAIEAAGVTDQIEFVGFLSDKKLISRYLVEGKVFVLPSYTEGLPRSMIEAASLGVPIVCTPVGGIPLVFEDGKSAVFVALRSAEDLADKIESLLNQIDDDQTMHMVQNAREIAKEHSFSVRGLYFVDNVVC